jgi:hypothetical protein
VAQAWHAAIPILEDAEISDQAEAASMSILSIQEGYARNTADRYSPGGSMCTLEFSLPVSVRYISFGVDPDPECNGDLNDSKWVVVNNTIIYQYINLFYSVFVINLIYPKTDILGNEIFGELIND